jgi:DNA-binding NtrC family response regulator
LLSKSTIVVIDDDNDIVSLFKEALEMSGYSVTAFTDPIKAFNYIKLKPKEYELVLSDYKMPSINGLELCTKLIEINPMIKVILMTAFINFEFDTPHFTCLNKPISIARLLQTVKDSLTQENTYANTMRKIKRKHNVIYNVKLPTF